MAKLGKDKIALFLACTSVLGGKTQAMNYKAQNLQTIGAVRGGARNQTKKINWEKIAKIGGFSVAGLAALETIHSLIGGFTDHKAGSYSIGRAIRNRVKKNQLDPGKPKKVNSNDENDELKDDKMLHANFKKSKDQMEYDAKANINHIKDKIIRRADDALEHINLDLDSKMIGEKIDRLKKQMLDYQNINIINACDYEKKIIYGQNDGNILTGFSIKLLDNEIKKEFVDIIKIFFGVFTGELSLEKEEFKFNNFFDSTIVIKKEGKYYNMSFDVKHDNIVFTESVNDQRKLYIKCKY